jgi:hypothetical protein
VIESNLRSLLYIMLESDLNTSTKMDMYAASSLTKRKSTMVNYAAAIRNAYHNECDIGRVAKDRNDNLSAKYHAARAEGLSVALDIVLALAQTEAEMKQ